MRRRTFLGTLTGGLASHQGIASVKERGGAGAIPGQGKEPVVAARATAIVLGGRVVAVQVTDPGSGYSQRPTIEFVPATYG